jgi:hypothetical protein
LAVSLRRISSAASTTWTAGRSLVPTYNNCSEGGESKTILQTSCSHSRISMDDGMYSLRSAMCLRRVVFPCLGPFETAIQCLTVEPVGTHQAVASASRNVEIRVFE